MKNRDNHIDELIGKYLSGETAQEENVVLEDWLSQGEENRRYFEQLRVVFEKAAEVRDIPTFDTDEAWEKMKARMQAHGTRPLRPDTPSSWPWIMRIAAGLALVVMAGIFAYQVMWPATINELAVATAATIRTDTLPNGSEVVLNRNSQIAYAYHRREKKHVVALKGEAYFTMPESTPEKFVVEAADVFIEDIGTSFNVKAYPESGNVEVIVDEGEVRFYTASQEGLHLSAGETGFYDRVTQTFLRSQAAPNATAYKSRRFEFRNRTLQEIVNELNEVYDKELVADIHLAPCRLTVAFEEEDIEEIAEVIAQTLGLTAETISGKIYLKGDGCE